MEIDNELREVEVDSVREYVEESDNVVRLHEQIHTCDTVLAQMQKMLRDFQADLGGIGDEIKQLQDQSLSMNIKLSNRREAQGKTQSFLENVVLPQEAADQICQNEVNEAYMEYLLSLNTKLKYCSTKASSASSLGLVPCDTPAVEDVRPHMEKLRVNAVAKIRDFLVTNIMQFKKPKTNLQSLQKNILKFGYMMEFLEDHARDVATEVRSLYIETMGRTLHGLFKFYHSCLLKVDPVAWCRRNWRASDVLLFVQLHEVVATKSDVIAVEDSPVKV